MLWRRRAVGLRMIRGDGRCTTVHEQDKRTLGRENLLSHTGLRRHRVRTRMGDGGLLHGPSYDGQETTMIVSQHGAQ